MQIDDVAAVSRCAQGAWEWVLRQVRWDENGPWIPLSVGAATPTEPPDDRDCLYDGIAGLAPMLAEVRLEREWTEEEAGLAAEIVVRLQAADLGGDCGLYTGLAGSLAAIGVLDREATTDLLPRIAELATPSGWPSAVFDDPETPVNDVIFGSAGTVLACAWVGGDLADRLTTRGADALVASAAPAPSGVFWGMHDCARDTVMPNYSHGTAGVATSLAVSGHRLNRPDLVEVARLGAEHLIAIADLDDDGFRLPLQVPEPVDAQPYSYGWCHGPTGTANLFGALRLAGVDSVAGRSCSEWIERCDHSVETSGLPARLSPGFWDNDGRCCGTAGVLDAAMNRAQDTGDPRHLDFAERLVTALLDRAIVSPTEAGLRYWRFIEHRVDPPELDPGVGWMQGAAGIAAALSRYARIRVQGLAAPRVLLPDDWWMVRGTSQSDLGV